MDSFRNIIIEGSHGGNEMNERPLGKKNKEKNIKSSLGTLR